MGFVDLLREIRGDWPKVRTAKWIIFLTFALGALQGYEASEFRSSVSISVLRERLASAQDRLTASPLASAYRIKEIVDDDVYVAQPDDDLILINRSRSSTTTVRLPSAFPKGKRVVVKDKNGDAPSNHITIVAEGGHIVGLASIEITSSYGY